MTFERPLFLILVLAPLVWAYFERRRTPRLLPLALKVIALVLIALALAGPRIAVSETRTAVALLVDTSASIPQQDCRATSDFLTAVDRQRGRNWTRVIPFARVTRNTDPTEKQKTWQLGTLPARPAKVPIWKLPFGRPSPQCPKEWSPG